MALPFDLKECYLGSPEVTKSTLLDRIRPDTDIDKLIKGEDITYDNVFGFGNFNMN